MQERNWEVWKRNPENDEELDLPHTLLFLFHSAAFGQLTSADIVGTVTDATGAVVPNAAITLTNLGTNETRNTYPTVPATTTSPHFCP